jgi:hypothetical protein
MAKNIILLIGDGMGWEMAGSGAIYNQVEKEITSLNRRQNGRPNHSGIR